MDPKHGCGQEHAREWKQSIEYYHMLGKYGECLRNGRKHSAITDFGIPKPTDTQILSYCNYCEHTFMRQISLQEAAILAMLKVEVPKEPSIDDLLGDIASPPECPDLNYPHEPNIDDTNCE